MHEKTAEMGSFAAEIFVPRRPLRTGTDETCIQRLYSRATSTLRTKELLTVVTGGAERLSHGTP